jgi:signal transduction histidine kinase
MNTLPLHTRLTIYLGALLVVLALILSLSITRIAERYRAETTQRLNEGVAMYVTNELALLDSNGVNEAGLKELAHRTMTVNPSAEVYLLSTDGSLLATLVPKERIARQRIDLNPIQEFLTGNKRRPLYGDDPTSLTRVGVFSVAPVNINGHLSGYLYVILASNQFASVAAAVSGNYSLQIALVIVGSIFALTLLVGAVLFRQLTLPLRRLNVSMQTWSKRMGINDTRPNIRNEIAELNGQFELLAERITAQAEAIAARDMQRRELIANVSHDLRTPLASLHGYLETAVMKSDSLTEAQRQKYLVVAHRHSQQLGKLIGALFELSKLETGATQPQIESFSIADLVHDVALRFQLRARDQEIRLEIDIDRSTTIVRADVALVERALENLIDNALKHTPPQGSITLSTRGHATHVQLAVTDTGMGIATEDLPRVFDRLYRGRNSDSQSTGLGLAIVKRIVELHGQHIAIRSQWGNGARVEFGLPK